MLTADSVSWRVADRLIVDGVSLAPRPGSTVGLLGPNGSGKSSLIRLLAGLRTPSSGRVELTGQPVARMSRKQVARRIAVVEQQATAEVELSVLEAVRLGRIPHRAAWAPPSGRDESVVQQVIDDTGLRPLVQRAWHTLSGGERQRVHLARALAQEPEVLLLDEPTNHLDIRHQLQILALVVELPVTSIVAIHDLNLAAMYCEDLIVLDEGRVVAAGPARQVLTSALIAEVYGVEAEVSADDHVVHVRYCPLRGGE